MIFEKVRVTKENSGDFFFFFNLFFICSSVNSFFPTAVFCKYFFNVWNQMIFFRWICEFFHDWKPNNIFFFMLEIFFFGRILPLEFSIFFFLRKKILRTFFVKTFFSLIKWNRVKRNVWVLFCCPQVSLKKQKWTDKYTQQSKFVFCVCKNWTSYYFLVMLQNSERTD